MATHQINSEQQIYLKIAEFLRVGKKFALAVVMKDAGSTPRKAGTKAMIDEEGSIWGTIGGGLLESEARKMAMEAIRSGKPKVFDFKFGGTSAAEDKPVCGGNMRILIDPTAPQSQSDYYEVAKALKDRRRGVFLRVIRNGVVGRGFFSREWFKDEDDQFTSAVRHAAGEGAVYFWDEEEEIEGLAEAVIPAPLLLIGGGGHVGQALARHAQLVDFEVVVIDDREEVSDPSLFGEGIK